MENILEIKNLSVGYGDVEIVKDVTFSVKKGEIMGIVGESGCGKSTLLSSILQLKGSSGTVKNGSILFKNTDLLTMKKEEWKKVRGEHLGVVFQDPGSTLDPLMKIGKQFLEVMAVHGQKDRKQAEKKILSIFEKLNLDQGKRILNSYPYELSGGMNQRVAIALAMVLDPEIIIADEPTSALDVTVQVQVVETLMKLREEFGTTIIIVTHNMGVVARMADTVGVMYHGVMVEYGDTKKVLKQPMHPYTCALINAIPVLMGNMPVGLEGRAPAFLKDERGCSFRYRCKYCGERCDEKKYQLKEYEKNHFASCDCGYKGGPGYGRTDFEGRKSSQSV
ncbi:MAG: ABC transporter ATP-binding protein [Clostridiaceae bacterium]